MYEELKLLKIILDEAEKDFINNLNICEENKDKADYLEVLNWNNLNLSRLRRIKKKLL